MLKTERSQPRSPKPRLPAFVFPSFPRTVLLQRRPGPRSIPPKRRDFVKQSSVSHSAGAKPAGGKAHHCAKSCAWPVAQRRALVPVPFLLPASSNSYLSCDERDGVTFSHRSGGTKAAVSRGNHMSGISRDDQFSQEDLNYLFL